MNELATEWLPLDAIRPYPHNPRHTATAVPKVAESIKRYGWRQPIVVDADGVIVAGHTRWEAAALLGLERVPVHRANDLSPELAAAYRIADNRTGAEAVFDQALLAEELKRMQPGPEDMAAMGFDQSELDKLLREQLRKSYTDWKSGALVEDYGAPPLSVLDARQGYWQERKKWWNDQMGRYLNKTREHSLSASNCVMLDLNSGVSILDAFLSELMCLWFARPGYTALDPFAGDCVFGYVAASLGLEFTGIDLRQEQVDANQALLAGAGLSGKYICDDAANVMKHAKRNSIDFLFSCPPYADTEVYSDDPRDLSAMEHDAFLARLAELLQLAACTLKADRFACIVLGDVRGKDGRLLPMLEQGIKAMDAAGLVLWNRLVLVTTVGTASLRARRPFDVNRKLQRTHQYVLVFYKGDPAAIKTNFGPRPGAEDTVAEAPRWKVSAKWLSRPHDCTPAGIADKCGGHCCRWDAWPPRSGEGNVCPMLSAAGCTLGERRPVTCHLYPLRLNDNGTLVKHHRAGMSTSVCDGCANTGPPLVDAIADDLTYLFGADEYQAMRDSVHAGKDYMVQVPAWVLSDLQREAELEAINAPPETSHAN